jgi:hypothetical protein
VTSLLTPHFRAVEFLVSKEHPDLAAKMFLSEQELNSCYLLCLFILEPIRKRYGPVRILSGKRSRALNEAVGGRPESQHLDATAADIFCPLPPTMEFVFGWVKDELQWPGEAIWYQTRGFMHVALPRYGTTSNIFAKT